MGTGKSTVGRQLAGVIGYRFVDMDTLIERRQKRSIRSIFQTDGEPFFRRLESNLCRELSTWRQHIIATGGGTLINPENLSLFSPRHLLICLDCAPQVLWQRLACAENRPMLDVELPGADRKARLMALLQSRQPAYAKIKVHIDTTARTVQEVVAEARMLWELKNGGGRL